MMIQYIKLNILIIIGILTIIIKEIIIIIVLIDILIIHYLKEILKYFLV